MTPDSIINIGQDALIVIVLLAAPLLAAALAIGLFIGMIQAATSINEATLSFVPKLAVMVVMLFATGPWLLQVLLDYTRKLIEDIPHLIG
ncbi:MAG: flagellar biosynthesis protein FliQ [Thiotrichales bacterium]